MGLGNGGADQFGIPNYIPGCNPVNSSVSGFINASCYTLPTVSASSPLAASCADFPFDPANGHPRIAPPAGQVYCANLLGNASRNSIYGPKLVNVDFSVVKNTAIKKISESFNVQFRAEIFNIFNRSNFLPPEPVNGTAGSQIFDQSGFVTAGGIDSLATQPRDVQLALKVIW
jgi:hypothetical protein